MQLMHWMGELMMVVIQASRLSLGVWIKNSEREEWFYRKYTLYSIYACEVITGAI